MLKKTLSTFLTALTLITSAYCALGIDAMNEQERKACGIEKLTNDEKNALNAWFEAKMPAPAVEKVLGPNLGEFTITDVQELGHFISLDNGMTFNIHSRSRKRTMAWKKGEKVRLVEPQRLRSFKLTNSTKKQTVSAKEK